jgi:hypothetical protein
MVSTRADHPYQHKSLIQQDINGPDDAPEVAGMAPSGIDNPDQDQDPIDPVQDSTSDKPRFQAVFQYCG